MKSKVTLFAFSFLLLSMLKPAYSQIPNPGFENWTVDSNNDNNPDFWSTTNSDPDVSVTPFTPAYMGNYSMKVAAWDPGIFPIGGFAMAEFPFNQRPACLTVCYKATIMPSDGAYIIVSLWQGDSIIAAPGDCTFNLDSTVNNFTCISLPITYVSSLTPDSANIMIVAGTVSAQLGTEIIVDELSFSCTASTPEWPLATSIISYPNPSSDFIMLPFDALEPDEFSLNIYNAAGELVQTQTGIYSVEGKNNLPVQVQHLANGIYHYQLVSKLTIYQGKFIVAR